MSDGAIEAWLRPPVELYSAGVAAIAAALAIGTPWALLLPQEAGLLAGLILAAFSFLRARQGLRVLRYQRNMRRLPRFVMRAAEVPVSSRFLYMGQGFRWTQRHTQRLRDALQPSAQVYLEPGVIERALRRFEDWAELRGSGPWPALARLTARDAWWNPAPRAAEVGGNAALHGVELIEQDVLIPLADRDGNTGVFGATGVGKTRVLEILVTQDIHRGDVVVVIDPKGDADLMRRMYAEARRAGRLDQFYLFHLGFPEVSARYNAIGSFARITEVATRLTQSLPSSGNSAAFKEFAWRFANIIAKAIVALGRKPSYREMQKHITDIEPLFMEYGQLVLSRIPQGAARIAQITAEIVNKELTVSRALQDRSLEAKALMEYTRRHPTDDPVLEGLAAAFKYERAFFDKIIASLGPLLDKLTTGATAALLSPDYTNLTDARPIFEWLQVIRQGGIVYVGLDALTDTSVAAAVGNSMFSDLVSVAGHLYKHGLEGGREAGQRVPKVQLHLDEFNELMGEEFIPMVNKARGAGYQVTAYTQTIADIEARIGNAAKAKQVLGNFNTKVFLRVQALETARLLTDQLPEVEVAALTQVSGVTDSAAEGTGVDFVSRNEDRIATQTVPMLMPSAVMSLPKGQAFVVSGGGQLWKTRMPLPDKADDPLLPPDIAAIASAMQQHYRSGEQWWLGAERALTVEGTRYGEEEDEPQRARTDETAPAASADTLPDAQSLMEAG